MLLDDLVDFGARVTVRIVFNGSGVLRRVLVLKYSLEVITFGVLVTLTHQIQRSVFLKSVVCGPCLG